MSRPVPARFDLGPPCRYTRLNLQIPNPFFKGDKMHTNRRGSIAVELLSAVALTAVLAATALFPIGGLTTTAIPVVTQAIVGQAGGGPQIEPFPTNLPVINGVQWVALRSLLAERETFSTWSVLRRLNSVADRTFTAGQTGLPGVIR